MRLAPVKCVKAIPKWRFPVTTGRLLVLAGIAFQFQSRLKDEELTVRYFAAKSIERLSLRP